MNYASTAFTKDIKEVQSKMGSRESYARMEERTHHIGLGPNEQHFIAERESFFMATYGQNDYPYIQHRGGTRGFLKTIDSQTLAFLDYTGNKQYISVGNLTSHDKVALIMIDYATRTRLKLYARAEIQSLEEEKILAEQLIDKSHKAKPERIILLHVDAFDWNCPQHIPQLLSLKQVEELIDQKDQRIQELEAELKACKSE